MTDLTGSNSPDDSPDNTGDSLRSVLPTGDIEHITSGDERWVVTVLGSLERPTMPRHVADRLDQAFQAESAQRATAQASSAAVAAGSVTALAPPTRRRGRWLVAATVGAAACALGVLVFTNLDQRPQPADGIAASVVPMSAVSYQYQPETLAQQATSQLPRWHSVANSAVANSTAPSSTALASSATATSSATASPTAAEPTETAAIPPTSSAVELTTRASITECLKHVLTAPALHVDIAMYKASSAAPVQQVAVIAVPGSDHQVDVWVVGIACKNGDVPLAHVRVPDSN